MTLNEKAFSFNGEQRDTPLFCPLCGRPLEGYRWFAVEGTSYYPSLVCYAGKPRWLVWLFRTLSGVHPEGVHYQFELPRHEVTQDEEPFDRFTGEPRP